jgi:cytochrome c-type biogenesis protein CcmH
MPMKVLHALVLLTALLAPSALWAVQPNEMLKDPVLEARARALSKELRCMVCQNESIDDSDAPLAHDLRVLVRDRIQAGDTDQQVLDFLVARYGEFVLLKPPLSWHTVALWGLPPGVLVIGALMIAVDLRRRKKTQGSIETAALTPDEQARLTELLRNGSASGL